MRPVPSYISQLFLLKVRVPQGLAGDHSSEAVVTIIEHVTANSGLEAVSSIIDFAGTAGLVAAVAAKLQATTANIAINLGASSDRGFAATAAAGSADSVEGCTVMARIAVAGTAAIAVAGSPSYFHSIIHLPSQIFYCMAM